MPAAPVRKHCQRSDIMPKAPVKNTFIHYDLAEEETPLKLRRVCSAPAELCKRTVTVQLPVALHVKEVVDDEQLAPARKKARVVSRDDNVRSGARSTVQGEDQRASRTAQLKSLACTTASKELTAEERHDKAKEWVSKMKETAGFKAYFKSRQAGDRKALAAPRTPDPALRITSKRKWERAIMSWRISLRQWGPVTVSPEDEA